MKNLKTVLHIIFLFLMMIIIIGSSYIHIEYPESNLEELLFYLKNGVVYSDSNVFFVAIIKCLPFGIIIMAILLLLFYDLTFGHNFKWYPFRFILKHRAICSIILFIISFLVLSWNLKFITYIKNHIVKSEIIENNYVEPKDTKIVFNEKRNVIIIVIESLESTLFNKANGGSFDENYIPELSQLLKEDDVTNFTTINNKNGMKMLVGSSWTTSSLISNMSAIPFKIPSLKSFSDTDFLNGSYNLGDLLYDNGYHNELISAAYTDFGAVKQFFTKHGHYNIIDYFNHKDFGLKMEESNHGPWGFNDKYLFEAAKERLNVLSKQDKPFNLTLVSIDTHFPDGYVGDYSVNKYDRQYANAYATESKLIYSFVEWVRKQPFYKDTLIVIIGDHQSMEKSFFENIDKNDRFVYTCYVNASSKAVNSKNRKYTSLDTYPSILGAMNVSIEGDKLGLGTNLFSKEQTLAEKYGFEYLDKELEKKSYFYNNIIMK